MVGAIIIILGLYCFIWGKKGDDGKEEIDVGVV